MYHLPSLMWLFCSLLLSGPGSTPSKMKYMFVEGVDDKGVIPYKAGGQQLENQTVTQPMIEESMAVVVVTQPMIEESMAVVNDTTSRRGGQKANDITSRRGLKRGRGSELDESLQEICRKRSSIKEGMKKLLRRIYLTGLKLRTAAEGPNESMKETLRKFYDTLCATWIHEAKCLEACGTAWILDTDHLDELNRNLHDLKEEIMTMEERLEALAQKIICTIGRLNKVDEALAAARREGPDVIAARAEGLIQILERQGSEAKKRVKELKESWIRSKRYLDDVTAGPQMWTPERKTQTASELWRKLHDMVDKRKLHESPEQIEPAEERLLDNYDLRQ
eukprot:GHVQ01029485.1.p1 GENE.GHVQ01029485.1~~GHVQ01029485.1.p1  ORF type:complete len:335 (+),score=40.87 GHVQ01029485.1:170-1174(+)